MNRTLAIDSPFQTFAVGLLVEISIFNAHLALFVRKYDIITRQQAESLQGRSECELRFSISVLGNVLCKL